MKIPKTIVAAALAAVSLGAAMPALAYPGGDHWRDRGAYHGARHDRGGWHDGRGWHRRGWNDGWHRRCWWEWHRHHRVRVCR